VNGQTLAVNSTNTSYHIASMRHISSSAKLIHDTSRGDVTAWDGNNPPLGESDDGLTLQNFTQPYGNISPVFGERETRVITASCTLRRRYRLVLVSAASGNVTLTLPAGAQLRGWGIRIRRTDASANTVTISPSGGDTIEGFGGWGLAPNEAITLESDGTTSWKRALTAVFAGATLVDATDLVIGTGTGSKLGQSGSKLGFFGVTPVARPSAYTQTYATADKTHANPTSVNLTGIASSSTGSALAEPSVSYTQAEMQQNFRRIQDQHNALVTDLADVKQIVNSVIDDLQALGLAS
jgi:hypothetical protein